MFVLTDEPSIRVHIAQVALACCSLEFDSAVVQGLLTQTHDEVPAMNVLVVSGTVTRALAPELKAAYDALPEPKRVVAFGACASSGGPYEGGYSIINGASELIPVDAYVPGCPPRPEALIAAIQGIST